MPTKTELIWDGKYDANGKRVAPLRVALPFQTVETINETAQDRQKNLFQQLSQEQSWRNRLVWGDKKYVLPSLLAEFAGQVNLIYIDPPFDTGADFSFTATVPDADPDDDVDDSASFTKQPSIIEQKAYRDTWGRGIDSYLQWFYETVVLLHELLAENGSIYVHLDWHVGHYAKCVLDEVFGKDGFSNEIIRVKCNPKNYTSRAFGNIHDVIYRYIKGEDAIWNKLLAAVTQEQLIQDFKLTEAKTGRRYTTVPIHAPGIRKGVTGKSWKGLNPPNGRHWAFIPETLNQFDNEGRIEWSETGNPRLKMYADECPGYPIQDIWTEFKDTRQNLYATQKPEALLDRIIKASSNEGDLVLDCFVGSGTTAAVAEKLNRRWIACDLGRFSIHTTRKRLLQIPDVRPFIVQNLGKYERQLWQTGQFAKEGPETPEQAAQRHRNYIEFILKLYGATPLSGRTWLHGTKAGRLIHVGSVEAPVSVGDVKQISAEFKKAIGSGKDAPATNGVDVLGWDFAFELNEIARQQAAAANIRMTFKRIPRDVMDKRAVEQGDIKFFELAALAVDAKTKGCDVTLTLTDFIIPPDDVPHDIQQAVKQWSQWIDYWAVDWDNQGDAFHNQWQTFRTRQDGKLALTTTYTYPEAGEYRIVVKVIDILGNDTTKTVKVKVK